MKKIVIVFALMALPFISTAQNYFDALEDNENITAIVVNKNMFKLMSKIDVSTEDPEAKEYLNLIRNIDNLKVFATEKGEASDKMQRMMTQYLNKANLQELMRVKDEGTNVKFYMKEGSTPEKVSELLMFVKGSGINMKGGKVETVLLTLTGDIDLKQVSKLTEKMDIPGGKHLKKAKKKN